MADTPEQRDFFISFNSADLAYAEAINAALRKAEFTTYFHPEDIPFGGLIPKWMDDALMNSAQMLALCSPEYMSGGAVYSEAERYARFWQDTRGSEFKLVPVVLKQIEFTPLLAVYKRIDATNKSPEEAAATVVAALKRADEVGQRETLHKLQPLPNIFNALYRPNPNFTGRFDAMESLQKSLRDATHAAITAVAGLGGVGKTTLAAECCHRFGSQYAGVWWVRAEQESVLLSDLVALGQRLKLNQTGNVEVDARAVLDYLAAQNEPWLMIYDNAHTPDGVAKWLPIGAVRCIITSRLDAFGSIAKVTLLDQWSDKVTAEYLLSRTGRDDDMGALQLAHTLGGLPVAAEQAAVFLRDRPTLGFDDYERDITRLIKEERPPGAKGEYPYTVYAAFVTSLEALSEMKGGNLALELLKLCSFLSPDGVDLWLLTFDQYGKYLPSKFASAIGDKFAQADAIAAIASLSLLRQTRGPMGMTLIFHRLLLEVLRDWMGAQERARWGSFAARLINGAFPTGPSGGKGEPSSDPSVWPMCARLIPHAVALNACAPRVAEANRALDWLFNVAGVYLHARGDFVGALTMAKLSVSLARLTETEEPLGLADSLANLGNRYSALDQLDEAEAAFTESLAIRSRDGNSDDPVLAIILSNLAEVHWKRGQFEKAEALLIRAMEIGRIADGPESGHHGVRVSNLGALYGEWAEVPGQGDRRKQEEEYKTEALRITRGARGVRHPETAIRHNNMSIMLLRKGDLKGAAFEAERAVSIMLSLDLAQHPYTSTMAEHLCTLWQHVGQKDKAAKLVGGDVSELLPVIAELEAEHRDWVGKDPENRHFGPPSPFA